MSMELLGNEFIENFYTAADAKRARRDHLEGIIEIFPWIATVDAFQHWIYTHPGHTRAERHAAWLELMNRFGGDVDWSGYEEAPRQSLAPPTPHFPASILLRRIRHRPTRRVAGLGEQPQRPSKSVERISPWSRLRRLASIARIVPGRGLSFRFQPRNCETVGQPDQHRAAETKLNDRRRPERTGTNGPLSRAARDVQQVPRISQSRRWRHLRCRPRRNRRSRR